MSNVANVKKVPFASVASAINKDEPSATVVEWNGVKIKINRSLSVKQMIEFDNFVVDGCFGGERGSYMPELKDLYIGVASINMYTNINTSSDAQKMYDFVRGTNITDVIYDNIDKRQFEYMLESIDKRIEHLAQSGAMELNNRIEKIVSFLEDIVNDAHSLSEGMSSEDTQVLLDAVKSGFLDDENFIRAYIDKQSEAGSAVLGSDKVDGDDVGHREIKGNNRQVSFGSEQ